MSGLGMPILIRSYDRRDLKGAAGVMYRSASRAYQDLDWDVDEQRVLEAFADRQESKWTEVWIAAGGSEVIGVMCLEERFVDQLFVEPGWQGKGVGKALMAQAEVSFPDGFELDVFTANTAALGFYEHLGLRIVKEFSSPNDDRPKYRLAWRPD